MLSGVRTRKLSVSFTFALARENAPKLIVTSTNAIKNATFLNIISPQNRRNLSPVVGFNDLSGSVLGCFCRLEGWRDRVNTFSICHFSFFIFHPGYERMVVLAFPKWQMKDV